MAESMSNLFTKGGKKGDILWAMAVCHKLWRDTGEKTDFVCFRGNDAVLPLIRQQPYIELAFSEPNWFENGCMMPARFEHYRKIRRGDYRRFPDKPLPLFICEMAGVSPDGIGGPWIFPKTGAVSHEPYVAYAWNSLHQPVKVKFTEDLGKLSQWQFVDVTKYPWEEAATIIQKAAAFIGCRSANYVLAHAVGQKNVIVFEPEAPRLVSLFGCPWSRDSVVFTAESAATELERIWREQ